MYKPESISESQFPLQETLLDDWNKHIDCTEQAKENLIFDHLKDVTLISKDGHKMKCHGLILSVRSKVFKAMLEPEKNGENVINIKDFDSSTTKKLLWFLYSNKVDEDDIDMDLLAISNMYQIESLQNICERRLCNELDNNNVLDAWMGANLFKRSKFLHACEKFLDKNWFAVQETESFSRIMKERHKEMATLAIKFFTNYKRLCDDF